MTKESKDFDETKRLMGALVRMKPKPHEEMKVGKRVATPKRKPKKAKPNT
jgi:hypothetical protein